MPWAPSGLERILKTPCGVDTAAPASGARRVIYDPCCKLREANVRGCVGTVVDLYGARLVLGGCWQILGSLFFADSAMRVALLANTTIKCKIFLPGVMANHSEVCLEESKSLQE